MQTKLIKRKCTLLLLALGLFCTSCSAGEDRALTETELTENEAAETGTAETELSETGAAETELPETESPHWLEDISGSYFKAGDFKYRLEISPGESDQFHALKVTIQTRDLESEYRNWSNVMVTLQELTVPYDTAGGSVKLEDRSPLSFNLNGSITLADGTEAAGDYYSFEENLIMPDAFLRPLNGTDLIGLTSEDMRLIRNEFYAVYGRTFLSSELQEYFENKPWYRKLVQPDSFNDTILGGMVKRNVEFLKEAEENYDPDTAEALKQEYGKLPQAPYLDILPGRGEVLLTIESVSDKAEDCGIYYKARGTIGLPLTFTAGQKRELEAGGALEVDAASLAGLFTEGVSGPGIWLKNAENSQYGEYVLLRTPEKEEEDGFYADAVYDSDTGVYKLWHNSGDTIFQRVYEGDIYVLKGACEEYYRNFDFLGNNQSESAGTFRVIDFTETEDSAYQGNYIVTDGRGYIKALYYYGD